MEGARKAGGGAAQYDAASHVKANELGCEGGKELKVISDLCCLGQWSN